MNFEGRFPNWHTLYETEDVDKLPWFFQDLDPDLAEALQANHLTRGRFLDLGTGPGTQAIALADMGFEAVGSDLSEAAIEKAQALSNNAIFIVDDILNTQLQPGFDYIFDRGCFHVLPPETREKYAQTVSRLLNPNGYLFLKPFSVENPEWEVGPYRFSKADLQDIFGNSFEIVSTIDTVYQGTLAEKPKALFMVARKRPV